MSITLVLDSRESQDWGGEREREVKWEWWPPCPPLWDEVTTLTSVPGPKLDMTLALIGASN